MFKHAGGDTLPVPALSDVKWYSASKQNIIMGKRRRMGEWNNAEQE